MKREELANLDRGRTEPNVLAANRLARTLAPFPSDDPRYTPYERDRVLLATSETLRLDVPLTLARVADGAAAIVGK